MSTNIVNHYIREQIALEEHVYHVIQEQIEAVDQALYPRAYAVLQATMSTLEQQYESLNALLDRIELRESETRARLPTTNGFSSTREEQDQMNRRVNLMLRDDYSALHLITMSNTLLHTAALAFDAQEVADTALQHLKDLAPLVITISDLLPELIAQELHYQNPSIDPTVGQKALRNAKQAWRG